MIGMQEDLRAILATNIRERRRSLGLTQTQLAVRLDATQPYVAQLERGAVAARIDQLGKIAEALETTAAQLLTADIFSTPAA